METFFSSKDSEKATQRERKKMRERVFFYTTVNVLERERERGYFCGFSVGCFESGLNDKKELGMNVKLK